MGGASHLEQSHSGKKHRRVGFERDVDRCHRILLRDGPQGEAEHQGQHEADGLGTSAHRRPGRSTEAGMLAVFIALFPKCLEERFVEGKFDRKRPDALCVFGTFMARSFGASAAAQSRGDQLKRSPLGAHMAIIPQTSLNHFVGTHKD